VDYAFDPQDDAEVLAAAVTTTLGNRRSDALADLFSPSGSFGTGKPFDAVRPRLLVVARAESLLGSDEFPAELVGYGTLPAQAVRDIAVDSTWQAIFCDQASGRVVAAGSKLLPPGIIASSHTPAGAGIPLRGGPPSSPEPTSRRTSPPEPGSLPSELSAAPALADGHAATSPPEPRSLPPEAWASESLASHSYHPSGRLQTTVIVRDQTCRFPGCQRLAWSCDIDHVEPFDPSRPAIDQTVASNLVPMCRAHHRIKTLAGWDWTRDVATGILTITSPHGRIYRVQPPTPTSPPWAGSGW
jgi:hypothetical protein